MTTERERFEAWVGVEAAVSRIGEMYANNFTQAKWDGWQARAALAQPAQDVVGGLVVRNCEFVGEPPPPFKNWVELLHAMLNNKTLNGVRLQATAASRNAAPQPAQPVAYEWREAALAAAPAAWTPEQIDAIHKDADEIGSKARTPRLADAPAAERSTDGAGAESGDTSGHCAESAPVRLPDKGSAAGSEAASDGCNPAPSTLSTDGGHRGLSDALRKGSGEKLSSWDRRSMSPPSTDAFEQECADVDAILGELGLDSERMRSEGGRLILSRIFEAIRAGRATVAEDAARLDWLDKILSDGNGKVFMTCLPGGLRAAIDAARGAP